MSVIQKIREKYATVMIVAIVVSLVAFLLMDAFVGPKSFFNHRNEVGSVNGEGLDYREFLAREQNLENIYRANQPDVSMTEQMRRQIREQIWSQFINGALLGEEYDKLGIGFTPEEMSSLTMSEDADPQIKALPAFQNPQTGAFDPNRVAQFIQELKGAPAGDARRAQWILLEQNLQESSLQRKFSSLIAKALYVPAWLAREKEEEKSRYADIAYVGVPYTSVPDSAVALSDNDLQAYLNNHQAEFHQEASRKIEYVSFVPVPTAEDSATVMKEISSLRADMDTLPLEEVPGFVSRNSETAFFDGYVPGSALQVPHVDSITALAPGAIYGPYFDGGKVTFAEMLDKKTLPDSVSVQHILLGVQQRTDTAAHRLADSLAALLRGGADINTLVATYSDDPGKTQNGGIYDLTPTSQMVPEFMQFAFDHRKGDIGVVKTQYGYHVMKVLDQKHFEMAYKIAYLSRPMDPSQQTDNAAFAAASRFAGTYANGQFNEGVQKEGLNKQVADNIKKTDFAIAGIDDARSIVQWAFGAKTGEVSQVFSLNNQYVVAQLTGAREEGTASLDDVRPQIEAAVRREKKAARIAGGLKGNTLQEVAASAKDSVLYAQHINFNTPFIPNAGFEPQVVGAAFNSELKGGKLSAPVYGNSGVYVLRVDSVFTEPVDSSARPQQLQMEQSALQQQVLSQLLDVLKKQGDVEDNRLKYF